MDPTSARADCRQDDRIEVTLSGGSIVVATAVRLYPTHLVAEWRQMLASAQDQLGGVSSGLGFYGNPGWVIGASLALGVLEGIASSTKAQEGRRTLQLAGRAFEGVRRSGRMFPIGKLTNLDLPQPPAWEASSEGESFAVLGDDFVGLQDAAGHLIQVRWPSVVAYCAILNGRDAEPPAFQELVQGPDPAAFFLG